MKGGKRWKQGLDTCVFKPSVACKEDPVKYPGNMPNMVSRIVPANSKDIEVETILREHFPHLVARGLVVVHTHICTPQYTEANHIAAANIVPGGGCSKITRHSVNLITPEYTDNFYNFLTMKHGGIKIELLRALQLLRGAICAAIELVPDTGMWVIHGDLHIENVLIRKDSSAKTSELAIYTALADWGRSIVFNKDSQTSIRDGLGKYLADLSAKERPVYDPFLSYANLVSRSAIGTGMKPQFSLTVLSAVHNYYEQLRRNRISEGTKATAMNALRGWMVYSLLKSVFTLYKTPFPPSVQSVLGTRSQAELITAVNSLLQIVFKAPYYTKEYVLTTSNSPPGLALAAPGPAAAAGAGAGPAAGAGAGAAHYPNFGGKRKSRRRRKQSRKKK